MSIIESIRLALGSISINKLRSFLTMFGIIIGISSVITITTIGNSLQKTLDNSMSELGSTNLIYTYLEANISDLDSDSDDYEYPDLDDDDLITFNMIQEYKEDFADKVSSVLATKDVGTATCTGNGYTLNTDVLGSTSGYLDANNLDIVVGRDISDSDIEEGKATAVVSDIFVKYVFGTDVNPLGQKITLSLSDGTAIDVYIVGVYKYDATVFDTVGNTSAENKLTTNIIIPVSYANQLSEATDGFSEIQIIVNDDQDPTEIASETDDYFNEQFYSTNDDWSVSSEDMASELSSINNVLLVVTITISVIAGISLLVGGVGVMNIMLVSVMERTKEIGIRKALGAKNSSIRIQFLMESIVICLFGGFIGIAFGILNGFLLSQIAVTLASSYASELSDYMTVTVQPSILAIFISMAFAMVTGIIFGYYPANRAAKMSPIDALRYE